MANKSLDRLLNFSFRGLAKPHALVPIVSQTADAED